MSGRGVLRLCGVRGERRLVRLQEWHMRWWDEYCGGSWSWYVMVCLLYVGRSRSNIMGTYLFASEEQLDVLGWEQHFAWIGRWVLEISVHQCGSFADRTAHCKCWWAKFQTLLLSLKQWLTDWTSEVFARPWEQRRLVDKFTLEGNEFGGRLPEGVLCVQGPGQDSTPAVLVPMTRMSRREADRDPAVKRRHSKHRR